jgi:aspartyl-tRNA(Asn)/glutamyl-tRNA(Gln) amidotransferase subunit A
MHSANPALPEILVALRRGALGATEHVAACLERIERSRLNAFVAVQRARALARAAELEEARLAGQEPGPLFGLALAIKDNFDQAAEPCAAGCRAYRNRVPTADAEAVRRLQAAGAVIVGRTGMHELADGVTSENPWTGPIHNPWRAGHHPGGSSGGSAAAVAARLVPGALGTDTGGSVRIPASLCGVVGLKPSAALVPTAGVVPLSVSLDHVGPLAGSVAGVGALLEALAGPSGQGLARAAREPVSDLRLGVLENPGLAPDPGVAGLFEAARVKLLAAGFSGGPVRIEGFERALSIMACIYGPEMAAAHAALLDAPGEDISPALRADLERGRALPEDKRAQAGERGRALAATLEAAFDELDVLLLPTTPHPARPFGSPGPHTYLGYTCAFNLSGQPALSLPMGRVDGLPVGLQLVARRGADAELLRAAAAAERALGAVG